MLNVYAISNLLTSITSCFIAIFVFAKGRKTKISTIWAIFAACVAIYGFGAYKASGAESYSSAFLWWQISYVGVIMLPVLFLHFVYTFIGIKRPLFLKSVYIITFAILAADIFSKKLFVGNVSLLFTGSAVFKPGWWIYPPGPLHIFHTLVLFVGLVIYTHIELIRAYKVSDSLKRQQIKYFFLATALGFTGGGTSYLPCFGINIYPVFNIMVAVYPLIMTYAIIRHQLMDIEIVIKKTLVFTSLFTIVFGMFVGIALLVQHFIGVGGNLLKFAISTLIIIFTVRPLEVFLVQVTDKYLFQKKYDYRHLIKEFMDELKTMVLNMSGIAQSTVDFFMSSIRPASIAIFIYNKFTNRYDLIASSEFKDKNFRIAADSLLIKVLGRMGRIIRMNSDELVSSQEQDQLKAMGIELIIPLLAHKELIGLLCLSKKKSDEDYTDDDIGTLSDLSGALSISLKNAQLFDERADAEKRALVGTIATGINHEVGNPLNIITIKLETFRILAREGMMANKTKEEIMKEVGDITDVCLDSVQRIAEITKQVAEFAKPDRKILFDKVNVGEAIDETIAVLKHGMILDTGKIEKKFMCDAVYAVADRGQLKQILFNLIKNASQAIPAGTGKITVNVDKNNDGEIVVKVIDNGCGMSQEVRDKVFTPFFTTKDPGKGTGLGLALVKIMVDRNGGRIRVESQEGQGTTFTLVFKGGLL